MSNFKGELESLLNRYNLENGSNTPDFVLSKFVCLAIKAFDEAVIARDYWFGTDGKQKGE